MKILDNLLILLMVMILMGCAGQTAKDKQVAKNTEFPENRFLTATAAADSKGEAKRQALSQLAAMFESRVYSETASSARSIVGDSASEIFEKQVDQTIRIYTDVKLTGARIGRVWQDENTGGYHAIAVLDRMAAGRRLENALTIIQMEIDANTATLNDLKGRLPRLAALNRITSLMLQKSVLESRLSVLGRPVPSAYMDNIDLSDHIAQRVKLAGSVKFYLKISGERSDAFDQRMRTLLTRSGYQLTRVETDAAGHINGKIRLEPLNLNNPDVYFIRAIADVSLIDQDTGAIVSSFGERVRKGHVDEKEAARRAVDRAADLAAQHIIQSLGTLGMEPKDETI